MEATVKLPIVAKLQIPDNALLLYENMATDNTDRTGNWRFFFHNDGCFFHARNTRLWVTDPALLSSDDPALYWNTPFPDTPSRCLTDSQQAELIDAIRKANLATLMKKSPFLQNQRVSDGSVERWTLVDNNQVYTVIVEKGAAPRELVELRTVIDRIITNAPRRK